MRVWGAAVSAAHLVLAIAGWALLGVPPWFFAGCAVLSLGIALAAAPLMRRRPGGGPGGPGGEGRPEDPQPPWWPGFERDFRAYERAQRRTSV
jgi:hypothetical protein